MATHSHPDDIPPPPYTETDIYSASGGPRSPISPTRRRDSHGDDATQSTSSTNGDIIYTPPLTPRSSHLSNFGGEADHASLSSSAAFFETRPAPPPLQNLPLHVQTIVLHEAISPDDLPYPPDLAARDVRHEDWQTFVNHVIPHYSAASNEQVIDRKLRAEGISPASPNPDPNPNLDPAQNGNQAPNIDDTRSQSSGRTHAEAQLDRIRAPAETTQRRQDAEATVREWNDGFFAPRRVVIRVETAWQDGGEQPM